jgi:hypothetical protein
MSCVLFSSSSREALRKLDGGELKEWSGWPPVYSGAVKEWGGRGPF